MKQVVVDSNILRSDKLRQYLSNATTKYAILTDYALIEAYKGATLASIYPSTQILCRFPKQVIVLKATQVIYGLNTRNKGLPRRFIDAGQTAEFSNFCKNLKVAKNGNRAIEERLLRHGREATRHMDQMLADAARAPRVFEKLAENYTAQELKLLRTGTPLPDDIVDKIMKNVMVLAAYLFRAHPQITKFPSFSELANAFIFRSSLCYYMLVIKWISVGSPQEIKPERMRNDLVDSNFAAYATYFDGLLTEDKKLTGLYNEARAIIGWMKRQA